jgi:hypothetical protein
MNKSLLILLAMFVSPVIAPAQTEAPDTKQKFAQAQKENAAAMHHFTWKSRTELKLKGESKKVKVEQVRYGSDGQLQKITLEESSPPPPEQKGGRRGARVKQKVVENKKEEFGELMQQLIVVAQSYGHIPPDQMQAFLKNAQFSMGKDKYQGTIQITGKGVLNPADSMNIWIDKQTLMMRRIEISTVLDNKPVQMTSEYIQMTNGPCFQSRAVLQYPEKGIEVTVDNFDQQQL